VFQNGFALHAEHRLGQRLGQLFHPRALAGGQDHGFHRAPQRTPKRRAEKAKTQAAFGRSKRGPRRAPKAGKPLNLRESPSAKPRAVTAPANP
jgi:hypothetical protein